jgi:hypothetical protein
MSFRPLPDNAARQVIDSEAIWSEFQLAKESAKPYVGGLYWKKEGAYEYLVRTFPGNRRERLGPRSPELELLFQSFHAQKEATKQRLSALSEALSEAQRLNKAMRAGRVPDSVVKLLNGFQEIGISESMLVVGTHALFAYESSAGVRIVQDTTLARGVDPFGDARRCVTFLVDNDLHSENLLSALRQVDDSYRVKGEDSENACIVNSKGFEVVFIHPLTDYMRIQSTQFAGSQSDGAPSTGLGRWDLLPSYGQTVISSTGKMATMRVLPPEAYIDYYIALASRESRAPEDRSRDLAQGMVVREMLDAKMLFSASWAPDLSPSVLA